MPKIDSVRSLKETCYMHHFQLIAPTKCHTATLYWR